MGAAAGFAVGLGDSAGGGLVPRGDRTVGSPGSARRRRHRSRGDAAGSARAHRDPVRPARDAAAARSSAGCGRDRARGDDRQPGGPAREARGADRPAGEQRSTAEIEILKDGFGVNGKSIMGVMMLAAECGSSHRDPGARRRRRAGGGGARAAGGRRIRGAVSVSRDAPWHRRVTRRRLRAGARGALRLSRRAGPDGPARAGGRGGPAAAGGGGRMSCAQLRDLGERVLSAPGPRRRASSTRRSSWRRTRSSSPRSRP